MAKRTREREHRPVPQKITTLASRVMDGEIRLPKFQRDFVWTRQQVLDLLDSIARGYPIGSFLLCAGESLSLASDQSIAGLSVKPLEEGDDPDYLLDGRQRLSTICGALHWKPDNGIGEDAASDWNLVYDLAAECFQHRDDLNEPPTHQIPLHLLGQPSAYFRRLSAVPELSERGSALFDRFTTYEVAVVMLAETSLPEIGRIFERVNTRGTPLTQVEILRAVTWSGDFDLLTEIDQVRGVLAERHYGMIDRRLLLRAVSAAAGEGFTMEGVDRLAKVARAELRAAIEQTEDAARRAVDFLTTEIGTPTAEALPYPNQLAVTIEIFRQVPRPTSAQHTAIRSWFWRTMLTGYFDGWNARQMAADVAAITAFAHGARQIDVETTPLSDRLWTDEQYRRGTARTKALALMLAAAGPRDLRTGGRIGTGRSLAMANEMQYHHFFPRKWLRDHGVPDDTANALVNIVLLSAISNQLFDDQPPSAYLNDELAFCTDQEMAQRLEASLISGQAVEAAMTNDYAGFTAARADRLLRWAETLSRGAWTANARATDDPVIIERALDQEIEDSDTDD